MSFGKKYTKEFQEKLGFLILEDKEFADQMIEILDVGYFEYRWLQVFVEQIFEYKKTFKFHPTHEAIENIIKSKLSEDYMADQIREYYGRAKAKAHRNEDNDYTKTEAIDFCRKQKLHAAMLEAAKVLEKGNFDQMKNIIDHAMKLGENWDVGVDYLSSFEERYTGEERSVIPTGFKEFDDILKGGLGRGEVGCIIGSTGCHAKGTQILMFDGRSKLVEDVQVGDVLMGPDSKGRLVEQLIRGKEQMYRIIPTKGEPFIVNENHILSLVRTNDETSFAHKIENVSLKEYLGWSKHKKHLYKLYRVDVKKFDNEKNVKHPYFIGVMLGDGSLKYSPVITSNDQEVIDNISYSINELGCSLTVRNKKGTTAKNYFIAGRDMSNRRISRIKNFLQSLGLWNLECHNKFVPFEYKTASIEDRKQILAGLLDTDGYLHNNGYDFISKSKQLSEDVCFIARSLGLAAYLKECRKSDQNGTIGTYFRVSISGDCSIIPCRIPRKQGRLRKQKKNVLRTGFSIEKCEIDDFYGFSLSGDHLYLTSDFTVHHNSGKSLLLTKIAAEALKLGYNVVYYTLEITTSLVNQRFDSCLSGIELDHLEYKKDLVKQEIKKVVKGRLITKRYAMFTASIFTIRAHLEKLKRSGFEPDLVILDYADCLKAMNQNEARYEQSTDKYTAFVSLMQEMNIAGWTASQTNRSGLKEEIITMEHIADAYNKCHPCDFIFSCSRTITQRMSNLGRFFVAKNRHGKDNTVFEVFFDAACLNINILKPWIPDDEKKQMSDFKTGNKKKYADFKVK